MSYVTCTGIINRSEAEDLLRSKWDGSFLVRLSDKIWGYVISYRCTDPSDPSAAKFKHFLIVASAAGYCLFGADDFMHPTLNDLVEYHSVSRLNELDFCADSSRHRTTNPSVHLFSQKTLCRQLKGCQKSITLIEPAACSIVIAFCYCTVR